MSNAPNKSAGVKQPRWRVAESTAAAMAYARRASGCQSWDEFFALLLAKWEGQGEAIPESRVLKEIHQIRAFLEHSSSRAEVLCLLEESHGESLQVLQTGQDQLSSLLQRLVGLLELAMGVAEPTTRLPSPHPSSASAPSESRGAEVLRKIRNRQLS